MAKQQRKFRVCRKKTTSWKVLDLYEDRACESLHQYICISIYAMVSTMLFKYQMIFISKWPTWVFEKEKIIVHTKCKIDLPHSTGRSARCFVTT